MLKVMTIVGTRPELIKMSRVIATLDKYSNHILVHTGQNYDYELNQIFFENLKIRKPDYFLGAAGDSPAKTIANVIQESDKLMMSERPDAITIYGDTNSCMAVIAAKRRKIPIFHMEAGNRCFDQRVPEELNRKVVDHLSDINMVLTDHARRYLMAEGVPQQTIIKTGSHMREVLDYYMPEILKSDVLSRLELKVDQFFIVSAHREENVDEISNLKDLVETLNALAEKYNYPIIVSTHPRTKDRLESLDLGTLNSNIQFLKPFGFFDYIKLQLSSFCVLSDSGTITEEASLLNLPAVMIRDTHERPEGADMGVLIMAGLKRKSVLTAVDIITSQHDRKKLSSPATSDYEVESASKIVLRAIFSYTNYVNRTVWHKSQ